MVPRGVLDLILFIYSFLCHCLLIPWLFWILFSVHFTHSLSIQKQLFSRNTVKISSHSNCLCFHVSGHWKYFRVDRTYKIRDWITFPCKIEMRWYTVFVCTSNGVYWFDWFQLIEFHINIIRGSFVGFAYSFETKWLPDTKHKQQLLFVFQLRTQKRFSSEKRIA